LKRVKLSGDTVNLARRLVLFFFALLSLKLSAAQQLSPAEYSADPGNTTLASLPSPPVNPAVSSAQPVSTRLPDLSSPWPNPYVYVGLFPSSGAGYSPAAGGVGAGLDWEFRPLIVLVETAAQDAHKLDSGTGNEAHLLTRAFYRTQGGWYLGGGAQWSDLATSIYSKHAWRPAFGGGKDFVRSTFSARAQALYILPGTDHLNALQGPELSLWLPSPALHHHWFYRQAIGIYEFHQTSVPGNPGLNNRSVASFLELTVMYRF
jgi:hypothetical protein